MLCWNSKNFNEENDGIVYAGTASLGFALAENILYVLRDIHSGFVVGIMRALTSIPLHTFCGVIMGYYIGLAKFADNRTKTVQYITRGLVIAIAVHGIYDTFALLGNTTALVLMPIVIACFIFIIIYLRKGRILSLNRSANTFNHNIPPATSDIAETSTAADSEAQKITKVKSYLWKLVVSRLIFGLCTLFWILLIIGNNNSDGKMGIKDLIIGGLIFTLIPALIGILLEVSYYRRRKSNRLY